MRDPNSGSVQLLKVDPELARGLDAPRAREAAERLYTRAIDIPRGRWTPQPWLTGGSQPIGLLVLEGLLVREATVSNHPCAELLGPGDLLRAWDDGDAEELLPRRIDWAAATSARIAIVDQALAVRMAQWPEIFAALMDRAARRAERLVVTQAIAHITRVDERLLALLWLLAERWGRVVPGGVLVSLRLPHRTLAGMVGARRPSVTTALGQLMARGAIERRHGRRVGPARPAARRAPRSAPRTSRRCRSRSAASASRAERLGRRDQRLDVRGGAGVNRRGIVAYSIARRGSGNVVPVCAADVPSPGTDAGAVRPKRSAHSGHPHPAAVDVRRATATTAARSVPTSASASARVAEVLAGRRSAAWRARGRRSARR